MLLMCDCGILFLVIVLCSGLLKYIFLLKCLLVDCWFSLVIVVLVVLCIVF